MATLITAPANTDPKTPDWQALIAWLEKVQRGYINITLTEMDSTTVPQIASGSVVEVNGSGYYWGSNESISGSPSAGNLNYIKMVSDTPTWTTTAPTWTASKGGWYNSNDRYVGGCYYETEYVGKFAYNDQGEKVYGTRYGPLLDISSKYGDQEYASGTIIGRTLYFRDLNITGNTTFKCNHVVVDGNMTVKAGATLTIESLYYENQSHNLFPLTNATLWKDWIRHMNYIPSDTSDGGLDENGAGCWGGTNGGNGTGAAGNGGGGSLTATGGIGGATGAAGASAGWEGLFTIGGDGADGNAGGGSGGGGGGAGPGASGGPESGAASLNDGGKGGAFCSFVVKGNLTNDGTIAANGQAGEGSGGENFGAGGGGGGILIFQVFGESCTFGDIHAKGGSGGQANTHGGRGGGGHIHAVGHTSDFTGLDVSMGAAGGSTGGGNGTTVTIDLDTEPESMLGGELGDEYTGYIMKILSEGSVV